MKRRVAGGLIFAILVAMAIMFVFVPPGSMALQLAFGIFVLVCFVTGLVSLVIMAVHLIFDDRS